MNNTHGKELDEKGREQIAYDIMPYVVGVKEAKQVVDLVINAYLSAAPKAVHGEFWSADSYKNEFPAHFEVTHHCDTEGEITFYKGLIKTLIEEFHTLYQFRLDARQPKPIAADVELIYLVGKKDNSARPQYWCKKDGFGYWKLNMYPKAYMEYEYGDDELQIYQTAAITEVKG